MEEEEVVAADADDKVQQDQSLEVQTQVVTKVQVEEESKVAQVEEQTISETQALVSRINAPLIIAKENGEFSTPAPTNTTPPPPPQFVGCLFQFSSCQNRLSLLQS